MQKPGSDLDDDEEDVTHIEQGEDLWQTRCDEEAVARGPGDAMAGGAEAGEVSPGVLYCVLCAFWDVLYAELDIQLNVRSPRQLGEEEDSRLSCAEGSSHQASSISCRIPYHVLGGKSTLL